MAAELHKLPFSPFSNFKIASHEVLRGLERRPCPNCRASRKYYCYVCYVTVGIDRSLIPTIKLPIKVDIIKHQGELVGKSTATHACILAPDDVTIHDYPVVPEFKEKEKVIILYPDEGAVSLKTFAESHCNNDDKQTLDENSVALESVLFIDSTWQQCHKIIMDKRLNGLKKVKLENFVTHFWRDYDGKYDNLLYFFAFQYNLIQEEKMRRKKRKEENTTGVVK